MNNPWFVIVNPNSGNFNINRDFEKIKSLFVSLNIPSEFIFTKGKNHAQEISSELILSGKTKALYIRH